MKKFLSFLLVFLFMFSVVNTPYAYNTNKTEFDSLYKVTQNSKEWEEFNTHDEMIKSCRIPQILLEFMPTKELVNAVLKYPLLYDIYAFDNVDDAIKNLKDNSDAFK